MPRMHAVRRYLMYAGFGLLSLIAPTMLLNEFLNRHGLTGGVRDGAGALRLTTTVGVVAIFWIFTGFLLVRRFDQPFVRLLFVHGQVLSITMVYPLARPSPWIAPNGLLNLSIAGFYLLAPLTLHMHISFPVILGPDRRRRQFLGLLYLTTAACLIAWLSRQIALRRVAELYTIAIYTAAIAVWIYAYVFKATAHSRRRLRIIWFGTLLAIVPANALYFVPGLYGWGIQLPVGLVGALLVIMPVSYLIVITRENLFGIDRLLNRSLVYILLASGIFIVYLIPLIFIYNVLSVGWLGQAIISAGITLVIGWNFIWLRTQVERFVDRLFYGSWYDYPEVIDSVSDALARSLEREQVVEVLTRQVPGLMSLLPGELIIGDQLNEKREINHQALEFTFRLQDGSRAIWYVLGHQDGEDFSAMDRRILNTLARQAEIALNNVILVEALRRQLAEIRSSREALSMIQRQLLRSREEERSRLARELHDGPLQLLIGMNIQIGMLQTSNPDPDHGALGELRSEVHSLLDDLRAVCSELRPPMLDTLGLGAALRALSEEWSQQHNAVLTLTLPQDDDLRSLPGETAVNLYRVTQESLVNIARHAQAANVSIHLKKECDGYELFIRDDGDGFLVPGNLHDLAEHNHFGLVGIHERVELIGGELAILSEPGGGTEIKVRL